MNVRFYLAASLCAGLVFGPAGADQSPAKKPAQLSFRLQLQPGQTLRYSFHYETETHGNTESAIQDPQAAGESRAVFDGRLRVEVLEVKPAGAQAEYRLRTVFERLEPAESASGTETRGPSQEMQAGDLESKAIQFTLAPGGDVLDIRGLEALGAEVQQAWLEWVAQFATPMTLPKGNIKRGRKWQAELTAGTPTLLMGLAWVRKTEYVRDEPCGSILAAPSAPAESGRGATTCAVLWTTAILKQKSSPKDATPESFRLRGLRTFGTARGSSETLSYLSAGSGTVVRSTASGRRNLDVTVAQADRGNRVRYKAQIRTRSEIQLVQEAPAALR